MSDNLQPMQVPESQKIMKINRHPHGTFQNGPQPAGFVSLTYAYDAFGNIKDRQVPSQSNYTVGQNPLELFAGRSYNLGVNPVSDNQIHNTGFHYDGNGNLDSNGVKDYAHARGPACGVGAAQGVRPALQRKARGARGIPPEREPRG